MRLENRQVQAADYFCETINRDMTFKEHCQSTKEYQNEALQ